MKELDKIRLGFCTFCTTYAEIAMNDDICEKLPDISLAEPVCFAGIGDGKRSDAVQASVYDAMMAEIADEHDDRLRKFERTHYVRNDGKPIKKDKRKANYSRRVLYFDRDLDDRFPNKGKSMYMTIRKYRDDMAESVRRADYDAEVNPEQERYVGKTTLAKQIDRKYAEMQKMKEEFCREHECRPLFDDYAVTKQFGFIVWYPDEYYRLKNEYEQLVDKQDKLYQQKIDKNNKDMRIFMDVDNGSLWTVNNKERWSEYGRV